MRRTLPAGVSTILWGAGRGTLVLGVGSRVAMRTWRYRRPPLAA